MSAQKLSEEDQVLAGNADPSPQPGLENSGEDRTTVLREGATILGNRFYPNSRYVTRYCVNRKRQRKIVLETIFNKTCLPCTLKQNNRNAATFIWSAISSDPIILFLHMVVLAIGAAKEALDLRHKDLSVHTIASAVETLVTCILVIIRLTKAKQLFNDFRFRRQNFEIVSKDEKKELLYLVHYVYGFIGLGILLIIADIFVILVLSIIHTPYANLAWTVLTNNFILILVTIVFSYISGIITNEMTTVQEDHHKAVLYEALLLLSESTKSESEHDKWVVGDRTERFVKAVHDTDLFRMPKYISCPEDAMLNAITSCEVVSMV